MDGNPATSWQSAPYAPSDRQWIEVALANATRVTRVEVWFDLKADALPTTVTVTAGYESRTIEQLRADLSAKTGENVVIRRFARFQVGGE